MKRNILLFLLCNIGFVTFGQKIKENSFDKFLKVRKIETTDLTIDMKFSSVLTLSIRSVDDKIFLKFAGRGYPIGVIGENDEVIILLTNDETIKLKSKGIQTYNRNGGATNSEKVFHYEYLIEKLDLESLYKNYISSIRIYSEASYFDVEINQKKHQSIKKLFNIFHEEYKKYY